MFKAYQKGLFVHCFGDFVYIKLIRPGEGWGKNFSSKLIKLRKHTGIKSPTTNLINELSFDMLSLNVYLVSSTKTNINCSSISQLKKPIAC